MTKPSNKQRVADMAALLADETDAEDCNSASPQLRDSVTTQPVVVESSAAPAPRVRPVKVTVEMSPVEHRRLKAWCATTAADLELSMVAGAEVLRVLWSLTQQDPDLAERLRAELIRSGGSRRQ